ncbi:uncharacterized protein LOC129747422 [Uranotaenia lowii]|uniref:uncharacterized protein LOC129747422 n=1 Tax=Uranotaenia lowii TaxID=190385 RepID=UPI00247861D3|nr:uncharacterized protein LOC129747422 [Uranotaenia lowii]XP_055597618.1 uncharacterized protein LOC129747422 [Uranotaenia lowii]
MASVKKTLRLVSKNEAERKVLGTKFCQEGSRENKDKKPPLSVIAIDAISRETVGNTEKKKKMASENKTLRLVSKNEAERKVLGTKFCQERQETVNAEHPGAWFNRPENKNKKPPLSVIAIDAISRETVRNMVKKNLKTGLDPALVTTFIYNEFCAKPAALSADWVSFNRMIGKQGQMISLNDIFDVKAQENYPPAETVADQYKMKDTEVLSYLIALIGVIRISPAMEETYRDTLKENLKALINAAGTEIELTEIGADRDRLTSYSEYRKVVAGVDMFLCEFPAHPFKTARYGSIITRCRDSRI